MNDDRKRDLFAATAFYPSEAYAYYFPCSAVSSGVQMLLSYWQQRDVFPASLIKVCAKQWSKKMISHWGPMSPDCMAGV